MSRRGIYLSTATAAMLGGPLPSVVATFFGYPLPWWAAVMVLAALPLLLATTALGGRGAVNERPALHTIIVSMPLNRDATDSHRR